MSTIILSCESLEIYVAAAQKMADTDHPVCILGFCHRGLKERSAPGGRLHFPFISQR